jgi:hypothetical protein
MDGQVHRVGMRREVRALIVLIRALEFEPVGPQN